MRVSGPDPATAVAGEIEVTVGGVAAGDVVPPEVEEDPEHPARNIEGKRTKQETCNEQTFIVGQF
jgi:hypothetical protein